MNERTGTDVEIALLKQTQQGLERQMGALAKEVKDESIETRNEVRRIEKAIGDRFDRMRNSALALLAIAVPIISALIGALIRG